MPWFPDFVSAVELARRQTRAVGQADPVGRYFRALNEGDIHALETVWPGEVVIYDPHAGEVGGHKQVRRFIGRNVSWLAGLHASTVTVACTCDNVGGEILDAVLTRLARGARIVLSGGVSQYAADRARGPANYLELIGARASMTGFLTPGYADRYPAARAELAVWLREGRLISCEDIIEGRSRLPGRPAQAVHRKNIGKLILAVP
jgi:NADPH:quinone reductase-like Zn-dependent oxidoreductase